MELVWLLVLFSCACMAGMQPEEKKVWLLHVGHNWGAHEYIDKTGYLQGFSHDLIKAVCKVGGMECETVWDKYENCWSSPAGKHSHGGIGLLDRWYDGCFGWTQTTERIHVFAFSQEYLTPNLAHFYVLPGNPGGFNDKNITGKKIGFFAGFAANEKCLAKLEEVKGSILPTEGIVQVGDAAGLVAKLNKGEIDAIFTSNETMAGYHTGGQVMRLPLDHNCMLAGNGMMARKDSELPALWTAAFNVLREGNEFAKLCEEANTKHGDYGTVNCAL